MSQRDRRTQGAATRKRIVRAAERLYAEQGVDAVSIRAVNALAGLGPASVHYHFGSKEQLLEAVLAEHGDAVQAQVSARVGALAARPEPPSARELVESVAEPCLELLDREPVRGLRWLKIVGQLVATQHELLDRTSSSFWDELSAQLRRAFADVDPARLELRYRVAFEALIQILGHADPGSGPRDRRDAWRAFGEELVDFVATGLEAVRVPRNGAESNGGPSGRLDTAAAAR